MILKNFAMEQNSKTLDPREMLKSQVAKMLGVQDRTRTHWKSYYYEELDRVICHSFEKQKISAARREELSEVKMRVEKAIRQHFTSDFRLDVYGSTENGFGTIESDLDLCFRYSENVYVSGDRKSAQIEARSRIENALKNAGFAIVMLITHTKVPIVKFDAFLGSRIFKGDISCFNELALHNTRLLKRYCSWTNDHRLSKLGMFVKIWVKQCGIGAPFSGGLSSYAYNILLIHFLQRLQPHPLLPMLQELGEQKEIYADGWNVYFYDEAPMPDWSKCTLTVGELYLEFLEYYAKFDWEKEVVQIRKTSKLSKRERGLTNQVAQYNHMHRSYTKKQRKQLQMENLQKKPEWRKMCIEDPFELDHDLGFGISDKMFEVIKGAFATSREVFFDLKERERFILESGGTEKQLNFRIPDTLISRYGDALLTKCKVPQSSMLEEQSNAN